MPQSHLPGLGTAPTLGAVLAPGTFLPAQPKDPQRRMCLWGFPCPGLISGKPHCPPCSAALVSPTGAAVLAPRSCLFPGATHHLSALAAGVARILAHEAGVTDIVVLQVTPCPFPPLPVPLCLARTPAVPLVPSSPQAALLHDTVEDTDTTFSEIEECFGVEVRRVVEEVTDDKTLPKAERKRLQVERAPVCSHRAKLVKLADKLYNLRDLNRCTPQGTARAGGTGTAGTGASPADPSQQHGWSCWPCPVRAEVAPGLGRQWREVVGERVCAACLRVCVGSCPGTRGRN